MMMRQPPVPTCVKYRREDCPEPSGGMLSQLSDLLLLIHQPLSHSYNINRARSYAGAIHGTYSHSNARHPPRKFEAQAIDESWHDHRR